MHFPSHFLWLLSPYYIIISTHTQRQVDQTVRCRLSAAIRERRVARMIPSCQPRLEEGGMEERVCRGSYRLPCNVPPPALHASSPPLLLPKFLSLNSLRHSLQKVTDSCCNGLDGMCPHASSANSSVESLDSSMMVFGDGAFGRE